MRGEFYWVKWWSKISVWDVACRDYDGNWFVFGGETSALPPDIIGERIEAPQ